MSKKLELQGDWAELGPKICLLGQSQTKYLEQNGVIQQNWTGKEKFGIFLRVF